MVGNLFCLSTAGVGSFGVIGWFEIVSYTNATTVVTDRTTNNGTALASGTGKVGGAVSLGSATTGITDTIFLGLAQTSATAAGRYFVKGGSSITYTLGQTIAVGTTGTAAWPTIIEAYASARGDRPTGATRPTFACGSNTFNLTSNWYLFCLQFTGTSASIVAPNSFCQIFYCKSVNSSTTAGRAAFALNSGTATPLLGCEAISYRGNAISCAASTTLYGCYIHDSDKGVHYTSSGGTMFDCIIANCVTAGWDNTSATNSTVNMLNNTFYGAENKLGLGITLLTASTLVRLFNNIFYGFTTGITHADTQTSCMGDYNTFFNNTNDVSAATQWQKGANDLAVNPTFTNVAQITGATATTTSGNHLVQSGATFVTSGVVAGRDFVHVKSGTGVTAGIYGIASVDSETQITTDIAITANATADKVWQITTGRDFSVGTAVKGLGYLGVFPGATSTGYTDIGAVQRQEPSTSGMVQSRVFTGM